MAMTRDVGTLHHVKIAAMIERKNIKNYKDKMDCVDNVDYCGVLVLHWTGVNST